jgi:hypothetical protein
MLDDKREKHVNLVFHMYLPEQKFRYIVRPEHKAKAFSMFHDKSEKHDKSENHVNLVFHMYVPEQK